MVGDDRLYMMGDDLAISSDHFKWFAELAKAGKLRGPMRRRAESLYKRAERLICDLLQVKHDHPELPAWDYGTQRLKEERVQP